MSSHDVEGEQVEIRWRKAESESVAIELPKTAIASLEKVAQNKDMSVKALLKFYIGRGLSDLSANQLLDAVAEVLGEHLGSAVETEQLMREICQKSAPIVMPAMMDARSVAGDRSAHH